jgi:hypothetical protein
MEKNACNLTLTCIEKESQGLFGSVLLSHNHLSLSAQLRILRFEIPSPLNSFGRTIILAKQPNNALPMPLCARATNNSDESCH